MADNDAGGPSRFPLRFTLFFALSLGVIELATPLYQALFETADAHWVDVLFRWRGMESGDPRINIIAIDDESLSRIGQYPWPRGVYEKLLKRLYDDAGVKTVGLDIMFLDPSRPDQDAALIRATKKAGDRLVHDVIVDPERLDKNVFQYPFAALRKACKAWGIVSQLGISSDGEVRETPLFIGEDKQNHDSWAKDPRRLPAFGLAVLARFTGKDPSDYLRSIPNNTLRLNIRGEESIVVGSYNDRVIKNTVFGFHRIPVWKMLQYDLSEAKGGLTQAERAALRGSIALVGYTAIGTYDHFPTPFTGNAPGVEVHANLIDNLLNGRYLRDVSGLWVALLIAAMAFASLGLMLLGPLQASFSLLALLAAWVFATHFAFRHLYVLDFTGPAASLVGVFSVLMVHKTMIEQQQKREVRRMFGQYVAPEVVDILVKDRSKLRLGGEKREMTVFFLDIAHFTNISEKMTPEDLIHFLNHYLSDLTDVIHKNKGVVDKYIGDSIMAFWNAPLPEPRHRELACLAAIECAQAIERLNREYKGPALSEMPAIRIGLNSGEMVVGNTGSEKKLAYTVLGDEVNLASRLEGANKFFGSSLMASESAYRGAREAVEARVLGHIRVVGKEIPIRVYELLGKKGELSDAWRRALPHYEKGMEAFLKRDFKAAQAQFKQVLEIFPQDHPSQLYRGVCQDYLRVPPPADWDGVFNLTAK